MVIDVPCVTLSYWYGKRRGSKVQFSGVIFVDDGILMIWSPALVDRYVAVYCSPLMSSCNIIGNLKF